MVVRWFCPASLVRTPLLLLLLLLLLLQAYTHILTSSRRLALPILRWRRHQVVCPSKDITSLFIVVCDWREWHSFVVRCLSPVTCPLRVQFYFSVVASCTTWWLFVTKLYIPVVIYSLKSYCALFVVPRTHAYSYCTQFPRLNLFSPMHGALHDDHHWGEGWFLEGMHPLPVYSSSFTFAILLAIHHPACRNSATYLM